MRITTEHVIDHDPNEKRETSQAKLALRDGRLVITSARSGSFHIPDYFSFTDVSWTALSTAHEHGHYKVSKTNPDGAERCTS